MNDSFLRITPDGATPLHAASDARATKRWISSADAAERSGMTRGHVNRLAGDEWQHVGLARWGKLPSGQQGWMIDEGADPRFAANKSPEQRADEFDWTVIPEPAKSLGQFRLRTVSELRQYVLTAPRGLDKLAAIEKFIRRNRLDVSARTLQRWDSALDTEGVGGLIDGRLIQQKDSGGYEPFYKLIEDWFLNQGEPSMAACYKLARREALQHNLRIPTVRQAQRHLQSLPRGRVINARQGPKAFDDQCAAYIQRDYTQIRIMEGGKAVTRPMESNDIWVADHHACDTLLLHKGKLIRPWLTAWMDMRSRKVVGYRFSVDSPNSSTVMLTLRDAAVRCEYRLPAFCYTDNGKDFDSYEWDGVTKRERKQRIEHDQDGFRGIYKTLQIGHLHAIPYNAKAKPIERWFRTYEESFGVFTYGYTGGSPQRKPEQLKDRVKKPEKFQAFEDYVREASSWIDEVYHSEGSRGQGMDGHSPSEVYAANLHTLRVTTEKTLLICLQKVTRVTKVGRNGITVAHGTYGKGDPALNQLAGQRVYLRIDPADIRYATVWTAQDQWLCTVTRNDLAIFDVTPEATYRPFIKAQKRHNSQLKAVQKRGVRPVRSPVELMIEDTIQQSRQRQQDNPPPPPAADPQIKLIRTGLEGQSIDDRPAFRQAAGGETAGPTFGASSLARLAEEDDL